MPSVQIAADELGIRIDGGDEVNADVAFQEAAGLARTIGDEVQDGAVLGVVELHACMSAGEEAGMGHGPRGGGGEFFESAALIAGVAGVGVVAGVGEKVEAAIGSEGKFDGLGVGALFIDGEEFIDEGGEVRMIGCTGGSCCRGGWIVSRGETVLCLWVCYRGVEVGSDRLEKVFDIVRRHVRR